MYLKSIEVQGFKSFANKIVFEFHNGITGIVGPNGSGKSNVADAVRWVLGEQRVKQLRGSSMQDVIFSGTQNRKPQGFAFVAITLDNSDHQLSIDYDEVTVSRRVYRSGESEYKINGSACRLKDVNELFYDTGIGKEGYSIIGQGQIDKILNGKPEERRELFDEAAGIVKFKRRKVIALKKLEDEKLNLVRVNDILSELAKQVGPLEKQSQTAKEYLHFRDELKVIEVNRFLAESKELKEQLQMVDTSQVIVTKDLEESSQTVETLKTEYEALDVFIKELEALILKNRESLNITVVTKGKLEGQINVLKEQIHTEQINEEHIESRITGIQKELTEKKQQIQILHLEREEIALELVAAVNKQDAVKNTLEISKQKLEQLDNGIETLKGSILHDLNEKSALAARQQRYETMLEQANLRRSEVMQKLLKYKSEESAQDEAANECMEQLKTIEVQHSLLSKEHFNTESEVLDTDRQVRTFSRDLNRKQQEYHTNHSKLESLRNIAERYEGYGSSIRKIMEVKDKISGIHGVVADLITVQKEYELAIETALGGNLQNIVTDSEGTAKQLIEYLKDNKYGRATFLPLTSIGSREFLQEKVLKEPGVLGLAYKLVNTDSIYEGLMKYLLGRIVVVDQMDHAIALAKKYQYSLRIVTLEGELLNIGGSMTGGAFKNTSNLLGRKREIEDLKLNCNAAMEQADALKKEMVSAEALLKSKREHLDQIKGKIQENSIKQNTLQIRRNQIEGKKAEIVEGYQDLVRENNQLEAQIVDINKSRQVLGNEITQLNDKNKQNNLEIERLTQELELEKQQKEGFSQEVSNLQLDNSVLSQKHNYSLENINRILKEIEKLEEESVALTQRTSSSFEIIQRKLTEIERLKDQITETETKIADLEQIIQQQSAQKTFKSDELIGFFQKREEVTQRVTKLDKETFRLQNQKEKLDEKLDGLTAYMWSEYELTYNVALDLKSEEFQSLDRLKKEIEQLKIKIRTLGNVNVNAIEDYKEISERYEFMKTQHDDLIKAEEVLLKIIDELDSGMRRQFEEKFEEIKIEFDVVFRELFGGGKGTLELMEGEDILEAGIQIISQPPGKKLQNMMQLSGGEKALTAIALLFAIQNLKPSPFCLLDEIEAALDDSNVGRFAGYLHKLTKNTQFIIITHRRGTMAASDRLYGITMQEKGVSTLVSVNLIENELEK